MLTPDEAKILSGVLYVIAFALLLRQMQWQVRVAYRRYKTFKNIPLQTKSAFVYLLVTVGLYVQYAASYFGIFTFGNTDRGPCYLLILTIGIAWWNRETELHNAHYLSLIEEHERTLRAPLDSVNGGER